MDTNLLQMILNARPPAGVDVNPNQTLIIMTMVIATLAPLMQAVVAFVNSRALGLKIEAAKIVSDKTAETVSSIKVDTNHDRTVMMEELRKLRESVEVLKTKNATLEEQKRSGEVHAAVAAATPAVLPAVPAVATPAVFTEAQLAQLTQALRGMKGPEPLTAILAGPIPMPVTMVP